MLEHLELEADGLGEAENLPLDRDHGRLPDVTGDQGTRPVNVRDAQHAGKASSTRDHADGH
jgi:hypothetical protein